MASGAGIVCVTANLQGGLRVGLHDLRDIVQLLHGGGLEHRAARFELQTIEVKPGGLIDGPAGILDKGEQPPLHTKFRHR